MQTLYDCHGPTEINGGRIQTERLQVGSGVVLADAILGYETHGELNANRSNVILYPT